MDKEKGKTKSSDDSAPPQPRSLRSRKRECPSAEIPPVDAVEATLVESPLQECAVITNQEDGAAGQSCLTKQDDSSEEKHAEEENVSSQNVSAKAFEGRDETTFTSPNNDWELEGHRVHTDNDADNTEMKQLTPQEVVRSSSQTLTDQLQAILPNSETGEGSCAAVVEKQLDAKENSQCEPERNCETSQEVPCDARAADVKEKITEEAAAGLPAKKKRRMGMCGLTEKERSHFLQAQRRENETNGTKRVEKQIGHCNTSDLVDQEEIVSSLHLPSSPLSTPADVITEQGEGEAAIILQSSDCGVDNRAITEVSIAATTSNGTSSTRDPGCSEGKSREAEGGTEPGPEQTGELRSDPPQQDQVEENLGGWEHRELEGLKTAVVTETPEKQSGDRDGGSTEVEDTNPTQNEETEKTKDGSKTASLGATEARVERKEETTVHASGGAEAEETSSALTGPGGSSCGPTGLCDAAVTPAGSGRSKSCDPEPGPSAEQAQTRDSADLFGSGCLGYVSDSQLNTIVLIEEKVMGREEDPGSSDCREDATDLMLGLIRELSSLNQKVMATHRELENLRRGSKTSRSSLR